MSEVQDRKAQEKFGVFTRKRKERGVGRGGVLCSQTQLRRDYINKKWKCTEEWREKASNDFPITHK